MSHPNAAVTDMGIPATVNVRPQEGDADDDDDGDCQAGSSGDCGSGADAAEGRERMPQAERSTGGGDSSASPDLCVALNNLAALLMEQGRHAEAEAALRRALALSERTVGRW
jgi:hypothetical protein